MKYRISGLVMAETFSEMSLRIGVQFMGEECIDLANLKILPFLVQDKRPPSFPGSRQIDKKQQKKGAYWAPYISNI